MTDKTEIELLAEALVGYRGVNGAYSREDDEGQGSGGYTRPLNRFVSKEEYAREMASLPKKMVAKFPGRCAASGEPIKPGDTVQFNPVTRTRILLQKGGA